ncbi:hypothetical protein TIFTF001_030331 [Ficus carica]|uniref:Uncharacterized protein n=1 Tax=Ficus carica TaxID=3494 RepID=A0AA88DXF2_FICCA|nr:hypothetical protein TIFTF001_030331 [Ficus carica]
MGLWLEAEGGRWLAAEGMRGLEGNALLYLWSTRSNGDTGGVLATDTSMLKSAMTLTCFRCTNTVRPIGWRHVSLWSDNRGLKGRLVSVEVMSDVLAWPGGESRQQDRHSSRWCQGPTEQVVLRNCQGNAIRADNTGPNLAPSRVGSRDGGCSIRFSGKRLSLVNYALVGYEQSQSDELHHLHGSRLEITRDNLPNFGRHWRAPDGDGVADQY